MKDFYVPAETKTVVSSGLIGAMAGMLTWGLNIVVQRFFVEPVFCQSADSFSMCANGGTLSFNIALVVVAIAAVVALVKVGGYRPLLVALAAVATLWSANEWLGVQAWWEATLWLALLSAISYVLYSWIARISSFPMSVAIMVVVVVLARLALR